MGYGNLGDAAVQEVVIANIRKRLPDVRLVGLSLVPGDTTERHGIPCYPIKWWSPPHGAAAPDNGGHGRSTSKVTRALKAQRHLRSCGKPVLDLAREARFWLRSYRTLRSLDLLIFSGGGQLGDLWRGPWSHPYTLFKFALLAKLARRPVYFLNVGAGPLDHALSRFFARWAVRLADYRSFRDRDSEELVRSLGVGVETHVYPDPVYALELAHAAPRPGGASGRIVGLNPIGYCDPRVWSRRDESMYRHYIQKMIRFSAWLLENGYSLRVFTTEKSVDLHAIEDLKAGLQASGCGPDAISQIFRPPSTTVTDVLREMAGFDFIVTAKFHGIIFSHLLGKPIVSLSYHRKMDAAMRSLGQERFNADIERFDVEWLIGAFRSLVDESDRIRSGCKTAVEARAADLSRQFDGLFTKSSTAIA